MFPAHSTKSGFRSRRTLTKQLDNSKRSHRLRCYRGDMNIRRSEGHEWTNGHRSTAPRREWNDRHFMNREPSLIDLTEFECRRCACTHHCRLGDLSFSPHGSCRFRSWRKWRSDWNRTWRRARRKCAAYLSGRLRQRRPAPDHRCRATALCSANEPACASTGIRKSAREH